MATHDDNRINGKTVRVAVAGAVPAKATDVPAAGSDQWHRALTGRQSPEPVSAKLRMIYGSVVAEALPAHMVELLARLDQPRRDRE